MSRFVQRFNDHPAISEFAALDSTASEHDLSALTDEVVDDHNRLLRALAHVRTELDEADPELVTPPMLQTLRDRVLELMSKYEAFKQSGDISGVNASTDSMLNQLVAMPKRPKKGSAGHRAQLDAIEKGTSDAITAVRARCETIEEKGGELESRLDGIRQEAQRQADRLAGQDQRLDNLITKQQSAFQDESLRRSEQFESANKGREESFVAALEDAQERLNAVISEGEVEAKQRIDHFTEQAGAVLASLEAHLESAKRIVGLIGNTGMTGHYQKVANSEGKSAKWMRGFALVFFLIMVAGVAWVVYEIKSQDFSWQVALFRVAVALALVAPAVYCARESTRHRREATYNRRIELELASIQPYLDTLPREKQQEIVERLADRYFGGERTPLELADSSTIDPDVLHTVRDIVVSLAAALSKR